MDRRPPERLHGRTIIRRSHALFGKNDELPPGLPAPPIFFQRGSARAASLNPVRIAHEAPSGPSERRAAYFLWSAAQAGPPETLHAARRAPARMKKGEQRRRRAPLCYYARYASSSALSLGASIRRGLSGLPPISILRGFMASGTTRLSSIASSPSAKLALPTSI